MTPSSAEPTTLGVDHVVTVPSRDLSPLPARRRRRTFWDGCQTAPTTPTPPAPAAPRPVQRRLSAADVSDICASYVDGSSIDELARSHRVNRTTIITHLDQRGVPRRRVVRKMTDALVVEAAARYRDGNSFATVAGV